MDIEYKQISNAEIPAVHELFHAGWNFAYSFLPREELDTLVNKYYSEEKLSLHLEKALQGKEFFEGAFKKDKLIGFIMARHSGNDGHLIGIYLEPREIRKGIGTKLMGLTEDFLKENGVTKYSTFVNKHNKIGLNFYKKVGFTRDEEKDKDDEFEEKVLAYVEKEL